VLNPGIAYTLGLLALARIPAGVATLIWSAEPIMILGLAALLLREPISGRLIAVMLIGAVGVLLVAGVPEARQTSTIDLFGAMLMLAAVFCCAVYTVISRNIAPGVDPLLAAAVQQTAGLAWALVLLPLEARGGVATHLAAIPGALVVVSVIAGLLYYAACILALLVGLEGGSCRCRRKLLQRHPCYWHRARVRLLG